MKPRDLLTAPESLSALDRPAEAVASAVRQLLEGKPADALLRGEPLGHPLHPVLVTVPIGAWTASLVLDLVFRNTNAARQAVAIGLAAVPPAALAGWADFSRLTVEQRRTGLIHAASNILASGAFWKSYRARTKNAHDTARLWSVLGLTAVGVGGALGGHLAYVQGAGVGRREQSATLMGDTTGEPSLPPTPDKVTEQDMRRLLDLPDPRAIQGA